ncbi:L,D-transpeptidase family protein [Massilia oculi]|uniref:L,D-transpeptidase family protein n=1 Tax=Massilia hydrophila TaxID=3044279 RepID=A0ABS7Y8R0_9BURK|nr:L,D-transpeptidase family protein [Massilia oculi]MCA1855477.1 L,D-transpeptidase family protein [Massilia oculi]
MIVKQHARKTSRARLWAGAILLSVIHACAAGAVQPPAPVPDTRAGADAAIDARQLSARLYATGPALLWLADGPQRARLALRLLGKADEHGLDPAPYGLEGLAHRLDTTRDPVALAALDRDISTAMLRYLGELHYGRAPSRYRPGGLAVGAFDPVAQLRQALAEGNLDGAVESAAPAIALYGRTREMLAHYRALSAAAPDWAALPPPGTALRPGEAYAGAGLLCARLRLLGDLDGATGAPCTDADGAALAGAVRRFQARHGLAQDGVPGPATLAALAVPPARRAAQLALTLERLRWLPPLPRGRVIAVNVPTYRLWAFDPDAAPGAPVLEMPVIVGTAARTPTPLFIGKMRYLEFNPYWNVPPSIQAGEIVPKLAGNPAYLRQNDMELVGADGKVRELALPDALAGLRSGAVRVRQRPGPRNVLGEVKFAMPNPMNIYLHSTSSKELFARSRRDLSHGCIRVAHPAALAQFVLADARRWDEAAVAQAMQPGPMRTVTLPRPVPVVLFYATALVDRHGLALFAQDIYRQDPALLEALGLR